MFPCKLARSKFVTRIERIMTMPMEWWVCRNFCVMKLVCMNIKADAGNYFVLFVVEVMGVTILVLKKRACQFLCRGDTIYLGW